MTTHQKIHRKGSPRLLANFLVAPLILGLAWADPAPTTSTTSTPPKQTASAAPKSAAKTTAAAPATASSSSSKNPTGVTKLPTIVVTAATRDPQPPDTTATTTTVLTQQQLDNAKYQNLPYSLQEVPGVSVVTSGNPGAQTSVFIHGLDSRMTLVTVDGRRQAAGLSGADDNLANLTLDNLSQVEVVRTPTSSVNGAGAMGGVINLVSLSGKGVAPQGSVSEEAGSFQSFRENIQSLGSEGIFDYAISASRQDSIYPALSPGSADLGNPGFANQADQYRNTAFRGNFGFQITPDIYVDLHGAYNNAYTSVPNVYYMPDPTANLLIEDWNLSPEIVAKVTDFYTTQLYFTHDQQRQAYNDPYAVFQAEFGPFAPYSAQGDETRLQINTETVDWQNNFQLTRNWSITAGIQSDNRSYYQYDDVLGTRTLNGSDYNIGGYVSSQWQPVAGLNILNSGRYDGYSAFGGAFSWRQGVAYNVAQTNTNLHGSVSEAYTAPTLQDLYVSYPGFPAFLSNPNLRPETNLGWEVGVEQPLWGGIVTPGATYFHNNVHDYIGNAVVGSNYMIENLGQVTTDGVEVDVKVKPCSTVGIDLNYTYLNAENDTTNTRLARRPRNTFNFTGTWSPIEPLTLSLGGNWVMGWQDSNFNTLSFPVVQGAAPDYFVLRAAATYEINKTVSVWIRGENLTNANYQPALGYYAPCAAVYGGVKVSF
jgi:vitamin B12 transporter